MERNYLRVLEGGTGASELRNLEMIKAFYGDHSMINQPYQVHDWGLEGVCLICLPIAHTMMR